MEKEYNMKKLSILYFVLFFTISIIYISFLSCETQNDDEAAASWQTVFEDSFNRTAGDLGFNWTTAIDGTSTLTTNGSGAIFNYGSSTTGFTSAYINSLSNNHIRITLTFQIYDNNPTGHISIFARSNVAPNGSNGEYYCFYVDKTKIGLAKIIDNNIPTYIGTTSLYTLSPSTTYKMVFELNASSLTGSLYNSSDTLLASVTANDPSYASGYAGFNGTWMTTPNPDAIFTEFKIEKYE